MAAAATAAQATPITYLLSGTGSGTVAGVPFTDAAYVLHAVGDTDDVTVVSGFPFPGTAAMALVTVTMEISGVGTAALTGQGDLVNSWNDASLSLMVGSIFAMVRVADYALVGYDMRSSFGPLLLAGPPVLSQGAQPSDLGDIVLDSSSAVTFEAITTCGNGVVDAGEDCDDGNASAADCCAPNCRFSSAGTTCRIAATPCDATEVCTGTSAICPPDGARADGASCFSPDICSAGAGTCQSGTCVAGPRDCDDHVACTQDSCDQSLGCVHADGPQDGCLTAPRSKFMLAPAATAGQAMLGWRWAKGAVLALGDLSDPTLDADYELCVYSGALDTLIADATFPAGAQWLAAGAKGYRFKEPAPKTVVRLRSGVAGKSSAVAKGRGIDLEQAFPFAAPVTVQLRKVGSPLCLESRFESLQRSDSAALKARLP
jgi:cysteine-rich repeat protein